MPLSNGSRVGPYEIVSSIGAGGMGEVYRARDVRLHREVALKVVASRFAADPTFRERFEREARAAAALNHPNICTVHDVGSDPPFLAMELLIGETLAERLHGVPLSLGELLDTGIGLADALGAAHVRGIIHRDIKPSNIFLTSHGPKITDFGLAKYAADIVDAETVTRSSDTVRTDPGTTVGTPAYMSPEQLNGTSLDTRSDLFSFGLVLYEMATGQPAFGGRTRAAIEGAILHTRPVAPSASHAGIPPQLDEVILKCLEKDRNLRCQTASEIRADLSRLRRDLSGPAPLASHPTSAQVGRRAERHSDVAILTSVARRHPLWLAMVGGLAIVVVAALFALLTRRAPTSSDLQVVALTGSGTARRPAIAPDGKYVAYIQDEPGSESLWIRQVAGGRPVEIVAPQAPLRLYGATISPDGSFIDFVRRPEGQTFTLWRVPLLGGPSRRLLDHVHSPIAWSPDAQHFAFVRADAVTGTTSVIVADAQGENQRVLAQRQRPAQFLSLMIAARPNIAPAWSLDGRTLAVAGAGARGTSRAADVDFIDVDTHAERVVPIPSTSVKGLAWIDGQALVLNAPAVEEGPGQLLRLMSSSGQISKLTNDVNDYAGLTISGDRTTVATSRTEVRSTIAIGNETGENLIEVARGVDWTGSFIGWARDRVLYAATFAGRIGIWTLESGSTQELIPSALVVTSTADGRTLVFNSSDKTRDGLWKADGEGRNASQLVAGDAEHPIITRDDRSVIFLSARGGQQSPWIVPLDGGAPRQLIDAVAASPGVDVSADGKSIVFLSRDVEQNRTTWLICELPDCAQQRSLPALSPYRVRWTPDGRSLAYIEPASEQNIWIAPLDRKPSHALTRFRDRTIVDFAWSRDGSRLAVTQASSNSDIVLFKGLRSESR